MTTVFESGVVTGWHEHGVTTFDHGLVACDASVGAFDARFLAAAGAVVSERGEWWAWRAFVRYDGRKFGLTSYWAEYVTLVHAVNRVDRGLVLCDLRAAVDAVSYELVGLAVPPWRAPTFTKLVDRYGVLPVVETSCAKKVIHVGRTENQLQHRAHLIAGSVRRAHDGEVGTRVGRYRLIPRCDAIAAGAHD